MPPFETMDRPQTAVLWPYASTNELGQPVVGSPIQDILVQWDDDSAEVKDKQGNVITVDATCFADRVIAIGSIMRYGSYSDWQGTGSGATPTGLMEVVSEDVCFDLKGRNRVFFYGLMRWNDVLPTS